MMTQDEFLERLWKEVVRAGGDGKWIDVAIKSAGKNKNVDDGRLGELLKGLLEKGVGKQEILELLELDRRETVFSVIHMVEEDGLEEEAWEGIHEVFETADPDGNAEPEAKKSTPSGLVLTLKKSHHIAFSPDNQRVVAATGGKITEITSGKEQATCELPPQTSLVAWSPSGKVIAMQSTSGAIRLCDAKTGKKIAQVKMACEGSTMDFSPDGKVLAAGDWERNLFTWNAANGKLLNQRELGERIELVCAGSNEIAVISDELHETRVSHAIGFDLTFKTELWRVKIGPFEKPCLHLTGEKRQLFGWRDGQVVKLALDKPKPKKLAAAKIKVGQKGYLKDIAVSPNGRYFCVVHGDEFILLDDSLRERGRQSIEYANAATFSADSSLVALASWNKGEIWPVDAFPNQPTK